MRTCPRCTTINDDSAVRCDCGFDLALSNVAGIRDELGASRRNAMSAVVIGAVIGVAGVAFTAVTYMTATVGQGGTFYVARGAIVGGILMASRGLMKLRQLDEVPQESRNRWRHDG